MHVPQLGKIEGFDSKSMDLAINKETGEIHVQAADSKTIKVSQEIFGSESMRFTREVLVGFKEAMSNPEAFHVQQPVDTPQYRAVSRLFNEAVWISKEAKAAILENTDKIITSIGVKLGEQAAKTRRPETFTVDGKSDPDSLEKMNTQAFGRREVDLGRYVQTGQLRVEINHQARNESLSHEERLRQTLTCFAEIVGFTHEEAVLLFDFSSMVQENGDINTEAVQGFFDKNQQTLGPYLEKAGPLHNACSQGVMIDLGFQALTVCETKVGVLEGDDRTTVTVAKEHIMVQHEILLLGKVMNEAGDKEVASLKAPQQFLGRVSIVGTIGQDGKITWTSVTKSLHLLPRENLSYEKFIDLQGKLDNVGLLTKDKKEELAVLRERGGKKRYSQLAAGGILPAVEGLRGRVAESAGDRRSIGEKFKGLFTKK